MPEPTVLSLLHKEREIACHAVNLFYEARNQSYEGGQWVLDVVANRVKHKSFPNSYCDVVTQRKAFSWYLYLDSEMPEDPLDWVDYVKNKFKDNVIERKALHSMVAIARHHYETDPPDRTGGAIYYMTRAGLDNVRRHIKRHSRLVKVGDHLFIQNINWR